MTPAPLTSRQLKALLHYDRHAGVFTWRQTLSRRAPAGAIAGTVRERDGRREIIIVVNHKHYPAHRLAVLYVRGNWPPGVVAALNGDLTDLRYRNLQVRTVAQHQQRQRRAHKNNRLGVLGVVQVGARYEARIRRGVGEKASLGKFDTPAAASAAYWAERERLGRGRAPAVHCNLPTLNAMNNRE